MYRVTNLAQNGRILLHRCRSLEIQVVSVSRLPPLQQKYRIKERDTCPPPPPPPPPKPPDQRLLWGTIALCVLAGGFAMFAKESPEVRDWLSMNAPWFDDFIAVLYQENMTFKESGQKFIKNIKQYFVKDDDRVSTQRSPKKCSLDGKPVEPEEKTIVIETGPDAGEVCKLVPPPLVTVDVCEVEKCIQEFCHYITINYMTARDACKYYNKEVEETMDNFTIKKMKKLHAAKAERIELVEEHIKNVKDTKAKLEELKRYFKCGVKAPEEKMDATRTTIKDCEDRMKILDAEYQWENDQSIALDEYCAKVEELVTKYEEEMNILVPGVSYDGRKVPVLQGDPDLLLYHTYRYVKKLDRDAKDCMYATRDRVNRGMESLPPAKNEKEEKDKNCAMLDDVEDKRNEMEKEYTKKINDQKARNDKALKEALKKQLERHNENMKTKLEEKEEEAEAKLKKLVDKKVADERRSFKNQLEEMSRKLQIVEDKLNERLKAEKDTKRSQELWAAGTALLDATKKGDPIIKVDKEIKAIEDATGDDDKLVETVLKSIPDSVKENGIVPESVLRDKYHTMEKVARRVALVEAEGAPLPVYLLSLLQSFFLFMKLPGIPQEEIDKPPLKPSKDLDTFDLLQRSRFWMQRGNLALALRYVDALQGASRAAANSWYESAREHLQTKQAAEAVIAHAAAMGLQHV